MAYTYYLSNSRNVFVLLNWCYITNEGLKKERSFTLEKLALNHKVVLSNESEKDSFLSTIKHLVEQERVFCIPEKGAKPDDAVMNKTAEILAVEETKEKQEGFKKLEEVQNQQLESHGLEINFESTSNKTQKTTRGRIK